MDFVVAQFAIVILPGLVWANLDSKYVVGVKPSQLQTVLKPLGFGLFTYGVLFVVYSAFGFKFSFDSIENAPQNIDFVQFSDEILLSLPLSLFLAILWMYFQNYRIFMRFLHLIGATKRFGDQDVWTFVFNSGQPHVEYVNLRNTENGYTYSGWVNSFSEREDFRELLLEDAIVLDAEGNQARVPHLYISASKSNIWLEFPYTENKDFYDGEP